MKRNFLVLVTLFCLMFSSFGAASAATLGTLSHWNSDATRIDRWGTVPTIWAGMSDNSITPADFSSYVTHAQNQWKAAGINSIGANELSGSSIRIYGGTYDTLKVMEPTLKTSNSGLAMYSGGTTLEGEWKYGTTLKSGYKIKSPVNVYIVQKSGKTPNGYKKTTTHELGHTLGWRGHSTDSKDIMYGTASEVTSLTSRDKNHLIQIY